MNTTIPQHHQIILDNLAKSQQVGGRKAIHDLYKACLGAFNNETAPLVGFGLWGIDTDTVKITAVTDMTTGMYVQLAQPKGSPHVLLTVGKKIAMETNDPVTCSRNTKVFF